MIQTAKVSHRTAKVRDLDVFYRKYQPPVLIVWGGNDQIFPSAGAEPYKRDLKTVEFHLLDAGHFAPESDGDLIARLMRDFLDRHVAARDPSPNQGE